MMKGATPNPATEDHNVLRSCPTRMRVTVLVALSIATATVLFGQTAEDSVGRRRIQLLPALGSAPETGLQFGLSTLAVWQPAAIRKTRPASVIVSALRTSKAQTRLRLDGEHWSQGNARRLYGLLLWQEFPLPYFGIGDRTLNDDKETYTPRGTEAVLSVLQRVRGPFYVTLGVRHLEQRIRADTVGVLQRGLITGSRGGTTTEIIGGVQLDTRDNLFAPRTGQWVQLTYARSDDAIWSDFRYNTMRFDARSYHDVGSSQVIALHVQGTGVRGDAPFDALALVGGGDIMRGYMRGRFRDRWVTAAQAEYRSPLWRRVGAVAFGGAGFAAPEFSALTESRVLPTYGAGLRLQLDARQRTGVRADYGRGIDGVAGLHLGFNQAF
jgi:hypothetical protein